MRRLFNKVFKKEKKIESTLNPKITKSKEYRALKHMNYIMNLYDEIESFGFDKKGSVTEDQLDDLFASAKTQSAIFMTMLLQNLTDEVNDGVVESKV